MARVDVGGFRLLIGRSFFCPQWWCWNKDHKGAVSRKGVTGTAVRACPVRWANEMTGMRNLTGNLRCSLAGTRLQNSRSLDSKKFASL